MENDVSRVTAVEALNASIALGTDLVESFMQGPVQAVTFSARTAAITLSGLIATYEKDVDKYAEPTLVKFFDTVIKRTNNNIAKLAKEHNFPFVPFSLSIQELIDENAKLRNTIENILTKED